MKKAKNTALCGMLVGISVVLMATTTLLPVLMYVLPILTSLLVLLVYKAMNYKYALGVYFATAILCLVLITDKEAALTYTLFFGYYSILKDKLDGLPRILSAVLKLLLFNCAAVSIGVVGVYILGLSGEEYSEFGKFTIPLLLGLANIVFLLFDFSLKKNRFLVDAVALKLKKKLK